MDEKTCVAKLIKGYILCNPNCTAKMISEWLCSNNFGLRKDYTPQGVANIIKSYRNHESHQFRWFGNIEWVEKNNKLRYYIKK